MLNTHHTWYNIILQHFTNDLLKIANMVTNVYNGNNDTLRNDTIYNFGCGFLNTDFTFKDQKLSVTKDYNPAKSPDCIV